MSLLVDIRFDAQPSNRVERLWRGADVIARGHFRSATTGEYVAVSGVTARAWIPGGALLDPAPGVVQISDGIWELTIEDTAAIWSGDWRMEIACTGPSNAVAVRDFTMVSVEPDVGDRPDPTWTDLEDLVAQATAAQAAAEAAASSSLGPMTLTSVGGTADGDGNVLTYTGTLTANPVLGAQVDFVPHAPNAAGPRIRPTVGGVLQSQISLRDAAGAALGAGALITGQNYRGRHDGTYIRMDDVLQSPRVVKATSISEIYAKPGDTSGFGRVRFRRFDDGTFLYDTGNGTNTWTSRLGYYDGAFRVYDQRGYLGGNVLGEAARILTDHYPPLTYRGAKHLRQQPWRNNGRTSPQRIVLTSAGLYQPGGLDTRDKRYIVISQAASGAWIDLKHIPFGDEVFILCQGTAVCHLWTGAGTWNGNGTDPATLSAHSWLDIGGQLITTSAGAWVSVKRDVYTFLATAERGSVAAAIPVGDPGGVAMPTQNAIIGHGPQSWAVDGRRNSAAGAVPRLDALGLGTSFYSPDTANVGASTLLYFAAKATLAHWDQRTDTPTRRLLDIIAAIQADRTERTALMGTAAPAMTHFRWYFGLNEMGFFGPSTTHPQNCPAVYTASFVKMCQYFNAALGYAVTHIITPLTAQKFGTFGTSDDGGTAANEMAVWHAVRMAQLRCPAAGAAASPDPVNIIIDAEVYGDPRGDDEESTEGERHYDLPIQAVQADRLIHVYANDAHAQDNWLGPFIVPSSPVTTADSGAGVEWDVEIDYDVGRAINQATRPQAAGFRLLPAAAGNSDADDWATPLEIVATRWVAGTGTTIKLRCTLSAPYLAGTPRPSVVWGAAEATEEIDCLIFATDPESGKRFYLRQYLSGG